jgi:hypothetical protein
MLEMLRRKWVKQLAGTDVVSLVIDTKTIPVMGYRRSKRCSDFHGSADYGYCAARKMNARHASSLGQEAIASSTGNRIWKIHRCNQHHQNSPRLKRLISRVRQRIEGVFHEI